MYCKHCGQQLPDDAAFCPKCGKAVDNPPPAQPAVSGPHKMKENAEPKKKKSGGWLALVMAIICGIIFFFWAIGSAALEAETIYQPNVTEEEYRAMCETIDFDSLARNPDSYREQMFKFTGEVIQVIEGDGSADLRLNVTAVTNEYSDWVYYEDTIYVTVRVEEGADKILEEDIITVYGICSGSYTYESILGSQVTLPRIVAMYYDMAATE